MRRKEGKIEKEKKRISRRIWPRPKVMRDDAFFSAEILNLFLQCRSFASVLTGRKANTKI